MAFIDYYKILGVDRNIPQDQVREAYRKRAKLFHPDLHPNDPKAKAKFQALNEAYDVISDPEKRKKYDQYGEKWREADAFAQNGGSSGGGNGSYYWSSNGDASGGSPFEGFDFSGFGSAIASTTCRRPSFPIRSTTPSSTSTTPRSMSARVSPSGRSSALNSTPSRPALS